MKKTPKPYLSYSQYSTLNWSEDRYIEQYIHKQGGEDNDFLRLGKKIHKVLEKRKGKEFKEIRKQIPVYSQREVEIKSKVGDVPLLGIIDGMEENPLIIADYKTGQKPSVSSWQNQMLFYNLMLFQKYKEIAKENKIYWIKTAFNDYEQLIATGEVREFDINIKLKDVIAFSPKVISAWERIKDLVSRERQMFGELPIDK
jgi:hypothetical protein